MRKKGKTVSLVLGSGGARGLAHIGVIQWLERNGYKIHSIAGSSMGALIGGIYAADKLDIYENWVRALDQVDVMRLLDFAFSKAGLFSGDRIINQLRNMLGDANIEDLPITFTAVASDLDSGREIWLNSGSLFNAIRASISIPTIFTPVEHHGHTLVDGGVLNPVPIAPTLQDVTDYTIAVSLSGKPVVRRIPAKNVAARDASALQKYRAMIGHFIDSVQDRISQDAGSEVNIIDVISRSFESMQNTIARFRLAGYNPDYLIEIPVNTCGMFEFHRADEVIRIGYEHAEYYLGSRTK